MTLTQANFLCEKTIVRGDFVFPLESSKVRNCTPRTTYSYTDVVCSGQNHKSTAVTQVAKDLDCSLPSAQRCKALHSGSPLNQPPSPENHEISTEICKFPFSWKKGSCEDDSPHNVMAQKHTFRMFLTCNTKNGHLQPRQDDKKRIFPVVLLRLNRLTGSCLDRTSLRCRPAVLSRNIYKTPMAAIKRIHSRSLHICSENRARSRSRECGTILLTAPGQLGPSSLSFLLHSHLYAFHMNHQPR